MDLRWGSLVLPTEARIIGHMTRRILREYRDPLEVIWTTTAARLGMTLHRSSDIYAHWDGNGGLVLGAPETLDADDSLAQMIFHEICHALVEGPESPMKVDWGLENIDDRDRDREHAAIRLQASLAGDYGLRDFFAVTTDFRAYNDRLTGEPLAAGDDPAIAIAQAARDRLVEGRWPQAWQTEIARALSATRSLANLMRDFALPNSLWREA